MGDAIIGAVLSTGILTLNMPTCVAFMIFEYTLTVHINLDICSPITQGKVVPHIIMRPKRGQSPSVKNILLLCL